MVTRTANYHDVVVTHTAGHYDVVVTRTAGHYDVVVTRTAGHYDVVVTRTAGHYDDSLVPDERIDPQNFMIDRKMSSPAFPVSAQRQRELGLDEHMSRSPEIDDLPHSVQLQRDQPLHSKLT